MPELKNPVVRSPIVLLIDDQALVAHQVKSLLSNSPDISLHYCADPAIAVAQALKIKPNIILLDLVMPHLDGLTLCRLFRETQETDDIPIVILSADDDSQTKANAFASGANDYLVKLPEEVELVARIRYHAKSYITKQERDDAYQALCHSQTELEDLLEMAYHDHLTQLPNRALFSDQLSMAASLAKRNGALLAVLFTDLDNFKPINDIYGHQTGDEVLIIVANRLQSCMRESDTLARLSGDEFAIALPEIKTRADAAVVAQKIVQCIAEPILLSEGRTCQIGTSVGISIYPDDAHDLSRLVAFADHAMYESKHKGKNNFTFFSDIFQSEDIDKILLEMTDDYMCGIKQVDKQHTQLVYLLNRLNLAINGQADLVVINALFEELLADTHHHFVSEEALFLRHDYPDAKQHIAEHQQLLKALPNFKSRFQDQGDKLEVLKAMKNWLLNHIKNADMETMTFLVNKGVK